MNHHRKRISKLKKLYDKIFKSKFFSAIKPKMQKAKQKQLTKKEDMQHWQILSTRLYI